MLFHDTINGRVEPLTPCPNLFDWARWWCLLLILLRLLAGPLWWLILLLLMLLLLLLARHREVFCSRSALAFFFASAFAFEAAIPALERSRVPG